MDKLALVGIAVAVVIVGGGWWYFSHQAPAAPTTLPGNDIFGYKAQDGAQPVQEQASQSAAAAPATAQQPTNNQTSIMQATLHTNKGDITFAFDEAQAPNTVANFIKLAQAGFYSGVKFHRVIKGFMIQGGDPLTKDDSQAARWGTGGPGYQFADENQSAHNGIGVVSMANSGPNTNGSQFFINTADNGFLDGKYNVFAHVTAGLDVVKAIESTQTGAGDRPVEPMVINSVTLQ